MIQSEAHHFLFYICFSNLCIYSFVYADNIMIASDDLDGIECLKQQRFSSNIQESGMLDNEPNDSHVPKWRLLPNQDVLF